MPYTFSIYPEETIPIPKIGDMFIVTKVEDDVTDYHWGKCVFVELQKVAETNDEQELPHL